MAIDSSKKNLALSIAVELTKASASGGQAFKPANVLEETYKKLCELREDADK
jgi:hypothetical protein